MENSSQYCSYMQFVDVDYLKLKPQRKNTAYVFTANDSYYYHKNSNRNSFAV